MEDEIGVSYFCNRHTGEVVLSKSWSEHYANLWYDADWIEYAGVWLGRVTDNE